MRLKFLPLFLVSCVLASAQTYTVTAFGPLSGGTLSSATAINTAGVVAGYSTFAPSSSTRAATLTGSTLTNLGAPSGATASWIWGMNDAGSLVGTALVSGQQKAFIYQNGGFTLLPSLGGLSGGVRDINNSGVVTGGTYLADNFTTHAFRYNPATSTMEDLGTLGGARSSANAINDNGWVVGTSDLSTSNIYTRAFVARPGFGMFGLTLGGNFSAAYGINNAGKVVGQSSLLNNDNFRPAFLFTGEAVLNIGTLGGNQATAYAINDSDVVVGSSLTATDNATFHAFIYQSGIMTDLNSLITPNSGWMLNEALAINNAGQIVGYGTLNGQQTGFILNLAAVPEPATAAGLCGLGALALVALRRRRS